MDGGNVRHTTSSHCNKTKPILVSVNGAQSTAEHTAHPAIINSLVNLNNIVYIATSRLEKKLVCKGFKYWSKH